jgi:hypothetical protein
LTIAGGQYETSSFPARYVMRYFIMLCQFLQTMYNKFVMLIEQMYFQVQY